MSQYERFLASRRKQVEAYVAAQRKLLAESKISSEQFDLIIARAILANELLTYRGNLRANVDHLTGLPNRRAFDFAFDNLKALSDRGRISLALLMVDIDHFKAVNDKHGHHLGDVVLRETAKRIQTCVRSEDVAARVGGEEFGVFIVGAADWAFYSHAQLAAERVRGAVAERKVQLSIVPFSRISVTVSIGGAIYQSGQSLSSLVQNADGALYRAKESGRDRVVFY